MVELLSQLSRKPSRATEGELKTSGWNKKREKVLQHLEKDKIFLKLLDEFTDANNKLKFIQSTKDLKIYFTEIERAGTYYTYARCFFTVEGKQKEFRKYIGKTDDLNQDTVDTDTLKLIFLNMLKNHLE
jgi:hypothetical protein